MCLSAAGWLRHTDVWLWEDVRLPWRQRVPIGSFALRCLIGPASGHESGGHVQSSPEQTSEAVMCKTTKTPEAKLQRRHVAISIRTISTEGEECTDEGARCVGMRCRMSFFYRARKNAPLTSFRRSCPVCVCVCARVDHARSKNSPRPFSRFCGYA